MGGGGGSIYTAYTKWTDLDCKLDSLALLNRLYGIESVRDIMYIAGLPQRYIYVSPPGEFLNRLYTPCLQTSTPK